MSVSETLTTTATLNETIQEAHYRQDYLYRLLFSRDDVELRKVVMKMGEMLRKTKLRDVYENRRDPEFKRLFDATFASVNAPIENHYDRYVLRATLFYAILTTAEVREFLCPAPLDDSDDASNMRPPGKRTNRTAFVSFIENDLRPAFDDLLLGVGHMSLQLFVPQMMVEYAGYLPPLEKTIS